MDLGSLFGFLAGFGLIAWAILLDGELLMFVNIPGILIVFGGTFSATLVAFKLPTVFNAFTVGAKVWFDSSPTPGETKQTLEDLASRVRREDILTLENLDVADRILAKGLRLAVDGVPVETIQTALFTELASMRDRHDMGQKVFRFMSATAPSMGMIGTLIGLVQMLSRLNDPSSIGPAMAIALLTTFYGAVLAFVVFGPMADKLAHQTQVQAINAHVVISGIESIVKGENAMIIREKLDAYLPPDVREIYSD